MTEIRTLLKTWAELMQENKQRLIELDGMVGDSDLGLTMADGFRAAYEAVRESPETDAAKLIYAAGKAIGAAVPSTMGTLMASGLMGAAKALKDAEKDAKLAESAFWATFFQGYYDAVQTRGKAQLGEKTFLDGLHPAVQILQAQSGDLPKAAQAAADAADAAFLATRGMLAKHGRMAIHGEQSREYLDPGAAVAALLMQGFVRAVNDD